jgi:hypothetical protein
LTFVVETNWKLGSSSGGERPRSRDFCDGHFVSRRRPAWGWKRDPRAKESPCMRLLTVDDEPSIAHSIEDVAAEGGFEIVRIALRNEGETEPVEFLARQHFLFGRKVMFSAMQQVQRNSQRSVTEMRR